MKLSPDYEVVRASILNRSILPAMDSILGELLREETQIITQVVIEAKGTLPTAFATQRSKPKDQTKIQCFECKGYGHAASHCKKRNYYVYCRQTGHIVIECPTCPLRGKGSQAQRGSNHCAYHVTTSTTEGGTEKKTNTTPDSAATPCKLIEGQSQPLTNEIQQLVQNSVNSAINLALSALGISSKDAHLAPIVSPFWIINS